MEKFQTVKHKEKKEKFIGKDWGHKSCGSRMSKFCLLEILKEVTEKKRGELLNTQTRLLNTHTRQLKIIKYTNKTISKLSVWTVQ